MRTYHFDGQTILICRDWEGEGKPPMTDGLTGLACCRANLGIDSRTPDTPWLPDGDVQILRSYLFGPSCFWTMAMLQNLIPSFPGITPPCPPPWRNPRKGRDRTLPSGNLGTHTHRLLIHRVTRSFTTPFHLHIERNE